MINSFQGEYRFLSNFWPCKVQFEGHLYSSVEHAYVASKTLDPELRMFVQGLESAGEVKRFGRKITIRPDFDQIKLGIMYHLVREKFFNDELLTSKLIATGSQELVEGNTWGDVFWGEYMDSGMNWLGRILMLVRSELASA